MLNTALVRLSQKRACVSTWDENKSFAWYDQTSQQPDSGALLAIGGGDASDVDAVVLKRERFFSIHVLLQYARYGER